MQIARPNGYATDFKAVNIAGNSHSTPAASPCCLPLLYSHLVIVLQLLPTVQHNAFARALLASSGVVRLHGCTLGFHSWVACAILPEIPTRCKEVQQKAELELQQLLQNHMAEHQNSRAGSHAQLQLLAP